MNEQADALLSVFSWLIEELEGLVDALDALASDASAPSRGDLAQSISSSSGSRSTLMAFSTARRARVRRFSSTGSS